jgi:hypothetical protein
MNSPSRPGLQRVIPAWVYRHLRFYGVVDIVGGGIAAVAGFICLTYGSYRWAALFLVGAALAFVGGSWYLTIARSQAPRT